MVQIRKWNLFILSSLFPDQHGINPTGSTGRIIGHVIQSKEAHSTFHGKTIM
jgi:hypothetical protein